MNKVFSRRWVLGSGLAGCMIGFGGGVHAQPPAVSLRPKLRPAAPRRHDAPDLGKLVQAAGLSGAVSFAVMDVATGEVLESYHPERTLPPASVAKSVTSLYALDTLGADHRFATQLMRTGPVVNGILDGDLVLVGGGDPTLDTDALAWMAADLKASGLHEVRGRFLVYGGGLPDIASIDPMQPPHAGYSPAVSGLSLNFNRVHFEWKPKDGGYAVAMDARSRHYRPDVAVARMKIVARDMPVYTYEDRDGVDHWTVARGALGKGGARWLPVRHPAAYAGDVFRTLARSHGIVLKVPEQQTATPVGTVMVQHDSAPLAEILRAMLKYSTNLTAEMVGLAATRARGISARSLRTSAAEMSRWAQGTLDMQRAALVDHSGLGGDSRLNVRELAAAFAMADRKAVLQPLLKTIALRDHKGNVRRNTKTKVVAKTGTLNFVSGLAGYVSHPQGRTLSFAFFAADAKARAAIAPDHRERPKGARRFNGRAKRLQQRLITRWEEAYIG